MPAKPRERSQGRRLVRTRSIGSLGALGRGPLTKYLSSASLSLVKQITHTIRLAELLGGRSDAWGSNEGRDIHARLADELDQRPEALIVRVSLAGIRQTDASFARASVIELAHRYRGRRGICLVDIPSEDVLVNWDAAALQRGQNLLAWTDKGFRLLGPPLREDTFALLQVVTERGEIGTAEVAKVMKKQVTNVSTRLKRLNDEGLVLRREVTAPSGGMEFRYLAIH